MARYKINDVEYPSPTEVLGMLDKPALKQWAVNMAIKFINDKFEEHEYSDNCLDDLPEILTNAKYEWKNVSAEAMDIGSEIHNLIEVYIKDGKDAVGEMRPEVENGFLAFLEWEQENIEEWLESEMTVKSEKYCYAGTLDAIARMKDGKVRVIDFKSSKGFYSGYGKQIAAYKLAVEEMIPEKEVDGCGILRLDKETGQPEWKCFDKTQERKTEAWLKLLDFYYSDKKRRLKNNPRAK